MGKVSHVKLLGKTKGEELKQIMLLHSTGQNNFGFKSRQNTVIHLHPDLDLELPDDLIHKYLGNLTMCCIF